MSNPDRATTGRATTDTAPRQNRTRHAGRNHPGVVRLLPYGTAAAWCAVFFPLLDTGQAALAVLALAGMGLVIPVTHCVQGSIIADTFPVHVRYSGSSLILQAGAILGGGLAPMISTALLGSGGSSTGVTWYLVALCGGSLVGAAALFRLVPEEAAKAAALPERGGEAWTTSR